MTGAEPKVPPADTVAGTRSVALDDVAVRYAGRREPALDGLDLEVAAGERLGVAGRTGAGKSTLALVAAGFIPRVVRARLAGGVTIGGVTIAATGTRSGAGGAIGGELLGRVGIVFSTPANQLSASKLTVREELAFGLENLGLPRPAMDPRIDEVLGRLGIAHLADREPFALSGGEQQRVAIASIVAMGTGILVLDEPTAQLDPAGTASVGRLLAELARDGTTILCAEHDPTILGGLDRCLVLEAGRAVADAPPGRALGEAVLGPLGLTPPTLVRLAEAAGIDPADAFDEAAVAAGLARTVRAGGPAADAPTALSGDAVSSTEPVLAIDPEAWRGGPRVRLAVEALTHRYPNGVDAVRGVDLVIEPGEAVAIVGQNGSGKTTLVKHLNGLLRPTEGRVLLDGGDIGPIPVHVVAATVGFVFQNPDDQLFDRSVEREVAFGPRNLGRSSDEVRRAVAAGLDAVGLESARTTNPYDLDLSLRKLVALASVLAMDPAVLVLDEPTTGQDGPGAARVGAIVDGFAAAGRTVVAITHDMEFAASHFRRIVVMREGRVVADGSPAEVFAPERTALLAGAGLEPPPSARIGARLGLGSTPTVARLFEALAGR